MTETRAIVLLTLCSLLATVGVSPAFAQQAPPQDCPAVRDVLLTNGKIHTMTTFRGNVESVRIVGDRFVEVGSGRLGANRCTRVIDLEGRTAVPGLIDNHNHIVAPAWRRSSSARKQCTSGP
jgi:predicted amidohydrolase YtcJ